MAKSGKGKVIQMLSPENYIRQKARNLPVFECLVNANWKESQMAYLVVSRQHTNGNITAGLYLVDLSCLGVKDSTWFFNIPMLEYRENLEQFMCKEDGIENIDYMLAHNIVYAGLEFADDYEFKPHKDFTSVTKYILDENTDDIPIIEIECGIDGLPTYMQDPLGNDAKAKKVIAQLERVAGSGNYYLINENGHIINDVDDFDDDFAEDQFSDMDFEEKGAEFLRYHKRIHKLKNDESEYFFGLLQSLVDDMVDEDKVDEYYDELFDEITGIEIDDSEIPDEMLGIEPGQAPLDAKIKQQFLEVINCQDDTKEQKKKFQLFKKNIGVDAAVDYLDLLISLIEQNKKFEKNLKIASAKYPNYALVQLKWAIMRLGSEDTESVTKFPYKMDHYFEGRNSIHPWEHFCYLDMLTHFVLAEKDFNKLEAMRQVIMEIDDDEKAEFLLSGLCVIFQVEIVANYIKNTSKK